MYLKPHWTMMTKDAPRSESNGNQGSLIHLDDQQADDSIISGPIMSAIGAEISL
jgi:hypothetical protein